MTKRTYTDVEFAKAIRDSTTIAGALRVLGYSHQGSAYAMVHREVVRLGLDTSHWVGQAHGTTIHNRIPLSDILVRQSTYQHTGHLRKRLIKERLLKELCSDCGAPPEWNGKPLTLQMDHINGDRNDNRIENLRLLCPNCHTQTPTFGGNKHRTTLLCACGTPVKGSTKRCRSCAAQTQKTKIVWPPTEDLLRFVQESSYAEVGRRLHVTGNTVKKRIARHLGP